MGVTAALQTGSGWLGETPEQVSGGRVSQVAFRAGLDAVGRDPSRIARRRYYIPNGSAPGAL